MKQPNSGKADPNEADNEFQAILYETNHKIVSYLRQVAKEGGGWEWERSEYVMREYIRCR